MTSFFSRRSALLCGTIFSSTLLVACGQTALTEQDVARSIGAGCVLVSYEKFVKISEDAKGLKEMSTEFKADCTPQGGTTKRRISGTMHFVQWQDWISKPWNFKKTTLDVDRLPPPKVGQSKLTYSDGPECNAKLERVATEVMACLQEIDPKNAERLEAQLETFKLHSRLFGRTTSENMALMQLEERCTQQWQAVSRQLPSDEKTRACLALAK